MMRAIMSTPCAHQSFRAEVDVNRFEDTGRFLAAVRVRCTDCGVAFRFLGVPAGLSWSRPSTSIDSEELLAPIEPADTPALQSRAHYEMPPETAPGRKH